MRGIDKSNKKEASHDFQCNTSFHHAPLNFGIKNESNNAISKIGITACNSPMISIASNITGSRITNVNIFASPHAAFNENKTIFTANIMIPITSNVIITISSFLR